MLIVRTLSRAGHLAPWLALACLCSSGCALTLDYGPPSSRDAGRADVGAHDAGRDVGIDAGGCRTERDCDDGDPCNGAELCVSGVCTPGEPVQCQDHDVCDGTDRCDPSTGHCVSSAPLSCTSDGDPCNGIERCDPVIGCTSSPPPSCDDGVDCTVDTCDPAQGCRHAHDNRLCTASSGGTCTDSGCDYPMCIEGTTCVADHLCFTAHCVAGTCVRLPVVCTGAQMCCAGVCVPTGCDDGQTCTDDSCDMVNGCRHDPHAGACDDHDRCTTLDHCSGTTCTGGPALFCPSTNACNVGICTAAAGCTTMPSTGGPCSDGNPCTTGDACFAGTCRSGTLPASCDDRRPCTTDACDPTNGCTNVALPDGTTCANAAMQGTCESGVCRTTCPPGTDDCDGDGVCECAGMCSITDGVGFCVVTSVDCNVMGCGAGQTCCPSGARSGMCVPTGCGACCL